MPPDGSNPYYAPEIADDGTEFTIISDQLSTLKESNIKESKKISTSRPPTTLSTIFFQSNQSNYFTYSKVRMIKADVHLNSNYSKQE